VSEGGGHHGNKWIQHHYDDGQHQFDSGKLAIWFFLVQEVLFFSGLFVAYILYRNHRPEIFAYAHHYLDVKWGAINTCVLIISSLTAAWSVRAAQLAQRKILIGCLAATILCACGFLGIKYIEYMHKIHEGLLFGNKFDPCITPSGVELMTRKDHCPGTKRSECRAGNIDQSEAEGWQVDCKVDEIKGHWETTEEVAPDGKKSQKKTLVEDSRRNLPVCEMVQEEHGPPEPENAPCWEIQENPWVCKKGEIGALVHYGDHEHRWSDTKIELTCKDAAAFAKPNLDLALPQSRKVGDAMFVEKEHKDRHELEEEMTMRPPPPHTNMFFSIYFAMTGLHGIHVLAGIFVYIWLLRRALRGDFTPDYFGPVDYAALYWHLVDLIWIFLFPMLYLIH
jgi:cytochrome c oxidase subunit 3